MKTLIFFGSPHKNGDCAALMEVLTGRLIGEKKVIDCWAEGISPCCDCRFCQKERSCAITDGMTEVYQEISGCDSIVLVSPVYFCQPTGRLLDVCSRFQKYYSERTFLGSEPFSKPKKGGIILTAGGSGGISSAEATCRLLLRSAGAREVFPAVSSAGTDKLPAKLDKAALERSAELAEWLSSR